MMRRYLAALVVILTGCAAIGHHVGVRPGDVAPSWSDALSSGGTLASASLAGKPVYLNFFATWCPPCNIEAPWIEVMQKRYGSRGLHVVGVDMEENAAAAKRFVAKYNLTYPVVVDSGALENLFNVNGLPVHVFIGRDGKIKRVVVGEMSNAEIESSVKGIL
jgi:cytochrome c biogenesis protein CcmG, thiol:disulfide interchange protein DsbE